MEISRQLGNTEGFQLFVFSISHSLKACGTRWEAATLKVIATCSTSSCVPSEGAACHQTANAPKTVCKTCIATSRRRQRKQARAPTPTHQAPQPTHWRVGLLHLREKSSKRSERDRGLPKFRAVMLRILYLINAPLLRSQVWIHASALEVPRLAHADMVRVYTAQLIHA